MDPRLADTLPFPEFASSVPTHDRASLVGISRHEVQAWTMKKSEEYRTLSYTMLSLHNAAAPIHILPTEVLVKIFSQTWQDRRSVCLTSVCHRWRSIYLSTPQFWAAAVSKLHFHYGRTDMAASGSSPTTIPSEAVTTLLERSSPCLIPSKISDRKSTRLNSSHSGESRMPSSA